MFKGKNSTTNTPHPSCVKHCFGLGWKSSAGERAFTYCPGLIQHPAPKGSKNKCIKNCDALMLLPSNTNKQQSTKKERVRDNHYN